MKTILASALLLIAACDLPTQSTVGSPNDTPITGLAFSVDSTYLNSSMMVARGRVWNNGTSATIPTWYVEAVFYTDTTYKTKLGGNSTTMNFGLDPGQSSYWSISFSTSSVDLRQFPSFRVKDVRGVYKR
ncbi:MAG: hypothetical protein MUE68_04725 [Bacteroidetes bacterium]|jgi:hypothetical protein|nr:hypothetical protein [Bacteroidota bacterium]